MVDPPAQRAATAVSPGSIAPPPERHGAAESPPTPPALHTPPRTDAPAAPRAPRQGSQRSQGSILAQVWRAEEQQQGGDPSTETRKISYIIYVHVTENLQLGGHPIPSCMKQPHNICTVSLALHLMLRY